jgi:hypothetical protein
MATIVQTIDSTERIRVALIIEAGRVKPVWFEQVDNRSRDRIFIKEVCATIQHMEGSTRVISFSVWDGANSYRLSLNTKDFTWILGVTHYSDYR